jgi:hypothetical protein
LSRKVMNIDRDISYSRALKHQQWVMDQWTAADFEDRLGRRFGERTQALAMAGGKDQAFHHVARV